MIPCFFFALIVVACASPAPTLTSRPEGTNNVERPPSAPKRVAAVVMSDPPTLNNMVNRATLQFVQAGGPELQLLISAGLGVKDDTGAMRPQLAEAVPSVENGQWQVLPDGRMTTTWKLRPGAVWHDGQPVTADDLLFTYAMVQDRELEVFRNVAYDSIERVEASDARTITVIWKRSYIYADTMFSPDLALPLPKHILESEYVANKRNVLNHPYWTDAYVGTGPFRVRDFVRSSHIVLEAFDGYVLGRPKIDQIDVTLIPDSNTLTANILAGTVELTIGRNVSLEEAMQVRDQWRDGQVVISPSSWIVAFPQFINPNPTVIADVRFRRALTYALDRQQMTETLQSGLTPVAHSFLAPDEPEYRDVERSIVRYDYDPRRAAQLLEELGYSKGADGGYRDAAGQRLTLEIRAITGIEINQKALFSAADFWQRLGVGVNTVVVPRAQTTDREFTATFPGYQVNRQGSDVGFLTNRVSSAAPVAETSFVGQNYSRYQDPAFDAFIERFFVTIPRPERMDVLGQVIHQMTDQALMTGFFFDGTPTLMGRRITGVTPRQQGWNAQEWDLQA